MGAKITLTPEQESWLKKHFKHTKNDDIARRLGISVRSVNRIASELGLKKSRQFMQKTQQNAANKANESHRRNGTYLPKGYIIPRSEEFRFRKGERPIDRIGKEREAGLITPEFHTAKFINQMRRRLYTKNPEHYKDWASLGESEDNWFWSPTQQRWLVYRDGKLIETRI